MPEDDHAVQKSSHIPPASHDRYVALGVQYYQNEYGERYRWRNDPTRVARYVRANRETLVAQRETIRRQYSQFVGASGAHHQALLQTLQQSHSALYLRIDAVFNRTALDLAETPTPKQKSPRPVNPTITTLKKMLTDKAEVSTWIKAKERELVQQEQLSDEVRDMLLTFLAAAQQEVLRYDTSHDDPPRTPEAI